MIRRQKNQEIEFLNIEKKTHRMFLSIERLRHIFLMHRKPKHRQILIIEIF
jgi:hypothetical protein